MAGICISDSMSGCENGNMVGLPGPPHAKDGNRQTALAITASLLYPADLCQFGRSVSSVLDRCNERVPMHREIQ
jgi:hypothetical protein